MLIRQAKVGVLRLSFDQDLCCLPAEESSRLRGRLDRRWPKGLVVKLADDFKRTEFDLEVDPQFPAEWLSPTQISTP